MRLHTPRISGSLAVSSSVLTIDTLGSVSGSATSTGSFGRIEGGGDLQAGNLFITSSGESVIQVGNNGTTLNKWEWHRDGERKWVIYNDGRTNGLAGQDSLVFKHGISSDGNDHINFYMKPDDQDVYFEGNVTGSSTSTGSFSNVNVSEMSIPSVSIMSSSVATRFDSRESDMTLATASIAAITASVATLKSNVGQELNTDSNVTFGTITSGDINSTGTITATEIHTTFVSSSIAIASGSNTFGDDTSDSHQFTGSLSVSGSLTLNDGLLTVTDNVDINGDLDVDGTTNLDVVDIDGAVNISSDSVPQLTIGGGTPTIYLGDSGAEDTKLVFRGNATDVYLALDDSVDRFLIGQGTTVGGDTRIYINPADGEVTASGNFAITDRLTVGAWDNSNSHGHANINISADANEGADSYLNFAAGTTIKGHIAFDHHATAGSQAMRFVVGDDAVTAMTILGDGNVGIGTTSPGYLTELRVNDTTVNTPRLVIRQLGTGDSSLAFQMPDSPYGFVMGVDNSDSDRFKISTGVGDVDSSPRFEIDPGGTTIHRYTGAENIVQIHSGVGSSTTGTSQIYFSSKDEHGGNTHQSYIKSTIDGTSSTSATKMTFHNRDSGGTVQEYMAIKADGLVQLNQNNQGSAGTSNKFFSVGGELSTQFDETDVGTMSGMIVSNEYTNASNQSGTACGIVFTHHSASSGISYIASKAGANSGDRSSLFFGTRGSGGVEERLRLEDNGEIFLGKGGDGYVRHYELDASDFWYLYAANDGKYHLNFNASGTAEFSLSNSGNLTILGSLTESSDVRLKENIKTIPDALSKVNQMRGVSYNRIGEEEVRIGMVADEVEKIIPELVRIEPNEDVEGLENLKSLAYADTVAVLVEAIKELSSQVTDLKKEIEDLKG